MRNGDAGCFEFPTARPFPVETANVRFESRAIQGFCEFPHLPLAAACFERASHQQHRPRH
jgi:hypothetical protein